MTGTDMVTENDRRWPVGLHGTPGRFGKLVEYHLFDAPFFAVHGKQAAVRVDTLLHASLQLPGTLCADSPICIAVTAWLLNH